MTGVCQHDRCRFGDIIEIDQTELRFDWVGYPIDAGADHAVPLCEAVLHVGSRLQDSDVERGAEQHLLHAHLIPVMRHGLDLRMQHGMIDEPRDAQTGGGGNQEPCESHFVRMDVWADVIDRVRSLNRPGDRERIVHVAYDHIADTHRRQSRIMLCTSHKSTHDRATRDERLDHGLACLAARARDKDHVHRPKGCAILPSLQTERSNDGLKPALSESIRTAGSG